MKALPELYRNVGARSRHKAVFIFLLGRERVELATRLRDLNPITDTVDRAIRLVGVGDAQLLKMDNLFNHLLLGLVNQR